MMHILRFLKPSTWQLWLKDHFDHEGVWIEFEKTKESETIKPDEALNIALCYGWIDGQIKRIDDNFYLKYFAQRRPESIWSTKNKASAERLIQKNLMMEPGLRAIQVAKENGQWERGDSVPDDYDFDSFVRMISFYEEAYKNFMHMSPSVQKTYSYHYFGAKKAETRTDRLKKIVDRLNQNLKPM
ncbi:MAG: hypothetical protein A2009_05215 [Tenericutes bacterium GWD2_38_27]|nr:MAG: hypothetical protein A2009_05215 [Tenericutes bacterium GWD2_38_27]